MTEGLEQMAELVLMRGSIQDGCQPGTVSPGILQDMTSSGLDRQARGGSSGHKSSGSQDELESGCQAAGSLCRLLKKGPSPIHR